MLTTASFRIARNWKQSKQQENKLIMQYPHKENYSILKIITDTLINMNKHKKQYAEKKPNTIEYIQIIPFI